MATKKSPKVPAGKNPMGMPMLPKGKGGKKGK